MKAVHLGFLAIVAASGGLSFAAAAADRVQTAPPEVLAWLGRTPPEGELEFRFPGWEAETGALIGYVAWRPGPSVAVSSFRSGKRLVITSQVETARVGNHGVFQMQDAILFVSPTGRETLLPECRIGLQGDVQPGLIGVVDQNRIAQSPGGGYDDWVGPAAAAWHVDRHTQRLTRETAPVYCVSEGGD